MALSISLSKNQFLGEYKIEQILGTGKASVVYLATKDDQRYALKVLKESSPLHNNQLLQVARKEASYLARLNHPGILKILDVGIDSDICYMVTELIENETLQSFMEKNPIDQDSAIKIVNNISEALSEVHKKGLLHRDIKPANILFDPKTFTTKVIDFGFMITEEESKGGKGPIVGTLFYCSPERLGIINQVVDVRSDIYALGVLFYEMLTGVLPFKADSIGELFKIHFSHIPKTPNQFNPEIHPVISNIVMKMISQDPEHRYRSIEGLLFDLQNYTHFNNTTDLNLDSKSLLVGDQSGVGIVGREKEMMIIEDRIQQANRGKGNCTLVEGRSGLGKTYLIDAVLKSFLDKGHPVIFAKSNVDDIKLFGPVINALDDFLTDKTVDVVKETLSGLDPKAIFLLKRFGTKLSDLCGETEPLLGLSPQIEQQRAVKELSNFLTKLSKNYKGLTLHLEDIQWLDSGTKQLLGTLAEDLDKSNLSILCSARDDEESEMQTQEVVDLFDPVQISRITIMKLDIMSLEKLISRYLNSEERNSKLIRRVFEITNGHPLAALEYLKGLIESGALYPVFSRWEVAEEELHGAVISKNLKDLVLERLNKLSENHRSRLTKCAVEGHLFSLSTLLNDSDCDEKEIYHFIEDVVAAGFVRRASEDSYVFNHDSIRESLVENIEPSELAKVNASIAGYKLSQISDGTDKSYYDISRYFLKGLDFTESDQSYQVLKKASSYALENFSDIESYQLIQAAVKKKPAVVNYQEQLELDSLLVRTAARVAKYDEALGYVDQLIRQCQTQVEKGEALYLKSVVVAESGAMAKSWEVSKEALKVLGDPIPNNPLFQVVSIIFRWIHVLFLTKTGWRFGKANNSEIKKRKVLCNIYRLSSYTTVYLNDKLGIIQSLVRNFGNTHYLGKTTEYAVALGQYSFLIALIGFHKAAIQGIEKAIVISRELKDLSAELGNKILRVWVYEFSGDAARGDQLADATKPEALKYGTPREKVELITAHSGLYVYSGHSQKTVQQYYRYKDLFDELDNTTQRAMLRFLTYIDLSLLGQRHEAEEVFREAQKISEPVKDVVFCKAHLIGSQIFVLLDRREFTEELENFIQEFYEMKFDDYWYAYIHVAIGYIRYYQTLEAKETNQKKNALKQLKKASLKLKKVSKTPLHRCHALVLEGYCKQLQGKDGCPYFDQAFDLATSNDFPWAIYETSLAIAIAHKDTTKGLYFSTQALEVATRQGWFNRKLRVIKEFGLSEGASSPGNSTVNLSFSVRNVKLENQSLSLLRVSQSLSHNFNFDKQVQIALDEIIEIMKAERAFLFIAENENLNMHLGRNKNKADVTFDQLSTTAVQKCFREVKSVLVESVNDMNILGSESAVIYNIKSILAVPMMVKDECKGVIYLDTSLARGMFSSEDVNMASAVASQIAISFENLKIAALEVEKRELEKDLELSGAVQKLFLPPQPSRHFGSYDFSGFHRSATQCSGDWWWYRITPDDRVQLFIGDVTGHGAGPAMVTAVVSTVFNTMIQADPKVSIHSMMLQASQQLEGLSEFFMAATGVEIDPKNHTVIAYSAGSLPIHVVRNNGQLDLISERSTLMGDHRNEFSELSFNLEPGDRMYLFTDGFEEQENPKGRQFGSRRLVKSLKTLCEKSTQEALELLVSEIDTYRSEKEQSDDYTIIALDRISTTPKKS